ALKQLEDAIKDSQDGSEKSPRSEKTEEDTEEEESEPSPRMSDGGDSESSEPPASEEVAPPPKEADADDELLAELDPAQAIARKEGLLVQEFGAIDDMNKAGLQRAKKDAMQQEVCITAFIFFF